VFRNKHRLSIVVRDITETYTGVVNGSVSLDADRGSSRDGGCGRLIGGEVGVVASQVRTGNIGDLLFLYEFGFDLSVDKCSQGHYCRSCLSASHWPMPL
jgi:hypothetical protein